MNNITASVTMLIRKPVREVFNAFVEPRIIEKFWLKHASAPLAKDASVEWEFMVEGAVDTVKVTEFVEHQIIAFEWSDGIVVRMKFDLENKSDTRLSIAATGFTGTDAPVQAINATEGFAIVVCDLKSLLETGQSGNMVRDKAILITADITAEKAVG